MAISDAIGGDGAGDIEELPFGDAGDDDSELPAVVHVDDVIVPISAFEFTATSMIFRKAPSYEEWAMMGQQLQIIQRCSPWWIGDWLLGGEALFGDKYLQAIEFTGNELQTLRNKQWVCHKIPPERRRAGLSFSLHAEVAGLPPEEQERWLDIAEQQYLTCSELRASIRADHEALPANESSIEQGPYPEQEIHLTADDMGRIRLCLERIANHLDDHPITEEALGVMRNAIGAILELLNLG